MIRFLGFFCLKNSRITNRMSASNAPNADDLKLNQGCADSDTCETTQKNKNKNKNTVPKNDFNPKKPFWSDIFKENGFDQLLLQVFR